jgi:hypothetical protein
MTEPRPPSGLLPRGPGRRLWRDVLSAHDGGPDELLVLEAACRLADELSRLEAELAVSPVLVEGSKGQSKPNPLFAEARNHRLALSRLLNSLGLHEVPNDARAKSAAGRKMALIRHYGGRNAS